MQFKILNITLLLLTSVFSTTHAADIKPFTTDGCSVFPDGTLKQQGLWLSCCTEHDKAYWKGGTFDERKKADEALRICVIKVGEPLVAELMRAGVLVGGTPFLPTHFRWGYGWPYLRGYKALTEEEKAQIKTLESK